ncbi:dynein axonemal intermediate chain 4-like [Macrobrachium rosenbergii]|uniref:dynein axonemal intermediate chain 4-like n=1 Tax=Macrobrachium rosenbergii TaxID=79674 RepID=UPI0034D3CEAD
MGTVELSLRVKLQETPTLLLFFQENTSVNSLDAVAKEYIDEWNTYTHKRDGQLVRTREVTCQTFLKYFVDKTSQKSAVVFKDTGSWATQWDMYDEYQKLKAEKRRASTKSSDSSLFRKKEPTIEYYRGDKEEDTTNLSLDKKGGGIEVTTLLKGLGWVERLLSTTKNINLLHAYTSGIHQVKEGRKVSMSSEKASIELLWQFTSDDMADRRVNSIAFCRTSPWLVLATYGSLGFTGLKDGILCGWNVKKIGQPELCLPLPGPPTVISACPSAPQLSCIALLDGTLLVYQLDTPTPQIVMDSSVSVDKHSGPVWAVEWRDSQVLSGGAAKKTAEGDRPPSFRRLVINMQQSTTSPSPEMAYVLISSSEDGTVKEWIFVKGSILCCTRLLNVRLPLWLSLNIAGGLDRLLGKCEDSEEEDFIKKGESRCLVLPQKVPATAMHFRPGDKTTYLIGTAAGDVLMCRTFERERCGTVYRGHTALVTRVEWRTAGEDVSSIFLSAALDDTIRVWFVDKLIPVCVLKMQETLAGGYVDACWCPWYTNLLAAVHGGGLHVWDISLSTHAPILTNNLNGASSVAFSPHTRNVIVGDSHGKVSVFHLEGLELSASIFFKYSSAISKLAKFGVVPVN